MKKYEGFKIFFLAASVCGTLFSGYMSAVKLFSTVCAFGETCQLFLGLPACYFGFAMFFLLLVLSVVLVFEKSNVKFLAKSLLAVSTAGLVFAGWFAIAEIPLLLRSGFGAYMLGLPTCIMGAIFFLAIFIAALMFAKKLHVFSKAN